MLRSLVVELISFLMLMLQDSLTENKFQDHFSVIFLSRQIKRVESLEIGLEKIIFPDQNLISQSVSISFELSRSPEKHFRAMHQMSHR